MVLFVFTDYFIVVGEDLSVAAEGALCLDGFGDFGFS